MMDDAQREATSTRGNVAMATMHTYFVHSGFGVCCPMTTSTPRQKPDDENDSDDDSNLLIFQDVLNKYTSTKHHRADMKNHSNDNDSADAYDDDAEHDVSLAFFELANASEIAYRIPSFIVNHSNNSHRRPRRRLVRIRQNSTATTHTGGVVWETSFLLLEFLLATYYYQRHSSSSSLSDNNKNQNLPSRSLGRVVEVGAGCGLLGIALAAAAAAATDAFEQEEEEEDDCQRRRRRRTTTPIVTSVTVTETAEVFVNLHANVQRNLHLLSQQEEEENDASKKKNKKKRRKSSDSRLNQQGPSDMRIPLLQSRVLDWTHFEQDDNEDVDTALVVPAGAAAASSSSSSSTRRSMAAAADTIIGTDVIFTPTLVEPLLATLQYLSHDDTVVFLCVQVRCATSHALFFDKVAMYNFDIVEISNEINTLDDIHHQQHTRDFLQWGKELECHIYRMRRINTTSSKAPHCK